MKSKVFSISSEAVDFAKPTEVSFFGVLTHDAVASPSDVIKSGQEVIATGLRFECQTDGYVIFWLRAILSSSGAFVEFPIIGTPTSNGTKIEFSGIKVLY